jgi:hypothetical protein
MRRSTGAWRRIATTAGALALLASTVLGMTGTAAADTNQFLITPERCEQGGGVVAENPIEPPAEFGLCVGGIFNGWLVGL